jgi:hypothetical protein
MLYLAGSGNEVAQAFGGRLFADFNDLIVIGTALTLGAAAWLLFAQVLPTWTLLARSLPRESLHHGVINLYWQALITLSGILFRGFQTRSLHKAARLRIEIELLNPIPERPRRLKYQDEEEYAEAREQWKKDKKDWQNDKKKLLHALVYEEEADRSIDVDTCSPLIDNDGIDRYFNALV